MGMSRGGGGKGKSLVELEGKTGYKLLTLN